MTILLYSGLLVISLATLLKGSDWFVDSAERMGLALGISPWVIGVTIIAFGTSLPEMAASSAAVLMDKSEIVAGNVIGSNIANIGLILGVAIWMNRGISFGTMKMTKDRNALLITLAWAGFIMVDGEIQTWESLVSLAGLGLYIYRSVKGQDDDNILRSKVQSRDLVFVALGLIGVYFGAEYTIVAVKELSLYLGVPADIIALSIVAIGTSLPELVVSIAAARRGSAMVAVGNVLGSNVFNILAVLGVPGLFGQILVSPTIIYNSLPVCALFTITFAVFLTKRKLPIWLGWVFLGVYSVYMLTVFLLK